MHEVAHMNDDFDSLGSVLDSTAERSAAPDDGVSTRAAPAPVVAGPECILRAAGHWWVVHTRARHEKAVAATLARHRVRYYLPLVSVRHTYAKSRALFRVPLFPGYLFLCGTADDREIALRTHRVANILVVQDQDRFRAELSQVHRAVESGRAVDLYPALRIGQPCRVTAGPLKGLEGVVVCQGRRCRMHLAVTMLGQSAVVEVDAALLEAAN